MKRIGIVPALVALAASVSGDQSSAYDPFRHTDRSMNALLGWSALSVAAGVGMLFHDDETLRWVGAQNILWGVIDAGVAVWARRSNRNQLDTVTPAARRKRFRRVLLVNGLLDIGYIGGGIAMSIAGDDNPVLKGSGIGITVQGGFLFAFDWVNYGLTFRE